MKSFFNKLFNEQKFFRRMVLLWSLVMLTMWCVFLMDITLLTTIGAAGATVVGTIFGILATVVGFYMKHRQADDDKAALDSKHQSKDDS